MLPNNNYLARKIGTNKTQILHRMRLRQFTSRQPPSDIPVAQREWQPDPEFVITHDDLYARAWECEYDEPIFDSGYNSLATPSPPEIWCDPNRQLTKRGTLRESYQKIPKKLFLSQTDHMTEETWIATLSLMRIRV